MKFKNMTTPNPSPQFIETAEMLRGINDRGEAATRWENPPDQNGGKTWISGGISSQSGRIVVANLTRGTTYTIQARALSGSTGQSAWSAPVTIMAT